MDRSPASVELGPTFWLSAAWIAAMVTAAATAEWVSFLDPYAIHWDAMAASPGSSGHDGVKTFWLGTDTLGRDILARLIYGTRVSMSVGLIAPAFGLLAGGTMGCIAGTCRGRIESIIIGLMDIVLAFPGLILLMMVSFYFGAGMWHLILSLGLLTMPAFCRVARAQTLSLTQQAFIDAARLAGIGNARLLMREIMPNIVTPLAAYGLMVVSFLIMAEGALSFLGLGVAAPTASWGGMIAEGKEVLDTHPHISMIPALVMFITVLAFNLAGDSLRRVLDRRESQL